MTTKRSLVPYEDSDEDESYSEASSGATGKNNSKTSTVKKERKTFKRLPAFDDENETRQKEQRRKREVQTSTGVTSTEPLKGDWLCYVFIPIPEESESHAIMERARDLLKGKIGEQNVEREDVREAEQPWHISLTRPIVLRAHEREALIDVVRNALLAGGPERGQQQQQQQQERRLEQCTVAFSRFAHFPSHDAERTFWAIEVGQGWNELKAMTDALDKALRASSLKARPYHSQPRFHASFVSARASLDASSGQSADTKGNGDASEQGRQKITDYVEEQLGAALRRCSPIRVSQVGIAVGKSVQWLPL